MKRVTGSKNVMLIECTNSVRGLWRIRWDVQVEEDSASYMEEEFNHKPNIDEIKTLILDWYNKKINEHILSGFKYSDMSVWLSSENQFNYKAAHDLAIQTGGASLPVTFKFGTSEEPVYQTFMSEKDISDFYIQVIKFVNETLVEGWKSKDAVDWEDYLKLIQEL